MNDSEPDFFTDPDVIADPRSYFDRIRAKSPFFRESHHNTLLVTGYDEANKVLNHPNGVFSSAVSVVGPIPPLSFTPEGDNIRDQLEAHRGERPWSAHVTSFDGAEHMKHRSLLQALLTPKRIRANEDYMRVLVDRVIDQFIANGKCNAATEYAHAVATYAISDLLGIPEEDRAELVVLVGAPPSQVEGDDVHNKAGADPLIFLKERIDSYLRERIANPGTDLLTQLSQSTFKDGTKPDLDTLSLLARFMFGAGQDTTSRLVAQAIRAMGEDPELQARVRANPELIPSLLEETLRFDPPVKVTWRIAAESTKIDETSIPAGTIVGVCLSAASNDPKHFENPKQFNIDRSNAQEHMAFSRGPHFCIGAPLARMEARIAIERLLARVADIRISEEHHGPAGNRRYHYEPTYSFRSLSDLHIEFTPIASQPVEAETDKTQTLSPAGGCA